MCSIAGIYWLSDDVPSTTQLENKVKSALLMLASRGPDESSITAVQNNCVMGGNRLIIRGSSGRGSMPFTTDHCTAYYNGEIYNYADWDGSVISDGEVILPVYETLGINGFLQFDGEFAISIWDAAQNLLILCRDPFGTKPIYFSLDHNRLLWASSASAINEMEPHPLCSSVKSSVYNSTYSVQEPFTSYSGIWLIPPGHALVVKDKKIHLFAYHQWSEPEEQTMDLTKLFAALERSLERRLNYSGTVGIPMSSGIDSGVIAFMADKLRIKYHVFSVIKMFGQDTDETEYILRRVDRLKHAADVTLLQCNQKEYELALSELYLPDYYDSEKFDGGSICMHTVFKAMNQVGIRVAIDGTGGDELFHGYKFRENFTSVAGWPEPWKRTRYYYSMFTSLLDYTAKADRAGAFFGIEARYPYQSLGVMHAAAQLPPSTILKWPLRRFLLERLAYGSPMDVDIGGKFGFSLENSDAKNIINDMKQAWMRQKGIDQLPIMPSKPFPFQIGSKFASQT